MSKMLHTSILLCWLNLFLLAQTFDISVKNQAISGTDLEFDIFILRTGSTDIYLGNCDLVLTFNHTNFTNPTYEIITEGMTGWYTFSPTIVASNRAIINIQQPPFSNQSQFNSRVQLISNTDDGTQIAKVKISGISNPEGTSGVQWRTENPNRTIINTLENTDPWNSTDISGNGNYVIPSDIPLPVQLSVFEAVASDGSVTLKWRTESEVNNAGFEIYRSQEEDSLYQIIASYEDIPELEGAGNSSEPHDYYFQDANLINGLIYWYKLADVDFSGRRHFHGPISAAPVSALSQDGNDLPKKFALYDNYPNPFNPSTNIRFDIPAREKGPIQVDISIFDITGKRVRLLLDDVLPPGSYTIVWDGRNDWNSQVASGIYILGIRTEQFTDFIKMIYLK